MLSHLNLDAGDLLRELEDRFGTSGIDEKNARQPSMTREQKLEE